MRETPQTAHSSTNKTSKIPSGNHVAKQGTWYKRYEDCLVSKYRGQANCCPTEMGLLSAQNAQTTLAYHVWWTLWKKKEKEGDRSFTTKTRWRTHWLKPISTLIRGKNRQKIAKWRTAVYLSKIRPLKIRDLLNMTMRQLHENLQVKCLFGCSRKSLIPI